MKQDLLSALLELEKAVAVYTEATNAIEKAERSKANAYNRIIEAKLAVYCARPFPKTL